MAAPRRAAASLPLRVHRGLEPWLSRLRPWVSSHLDIFSRRRLANAVNIADLRLCAERRAHRMVFDYIDSGADDEITLRRNKRALDEIELHYHVLAGVRPPLDLSTTLLGQRLSLPFFGAPAAGHRMFHEEGEVATARAAMEHGTMFALSTFATSTFEQVNGVHEGPRAFQLYVLRDREFVKGLLTRARAAGFRTLVLTADLTWFGKRERDLRNGFTVPPSYSLQQVREHKNVFSAAPAIRGENRKTLVVNLPSLKKTQKSATFSPATRERVERLLSSTYSPLLTPLLVHYVSYITFPFPPPWLHSCHRLTLSHDFSCVCLLSLMHTQVVGAIRRPAWAWDYISRPPYAYALLEADIPAESIAAYVNRQTQKQKKNRNSR